MTDTELLASIDRSLKAIVAHFGAGQPTQTATPRTVPRVAPDSDLDGQYGNPSIRAKDPRDWTGDSQLGKPFSECPPAYLDLLADRFDWFAEKAEEEGTTTSAGKPVAPYNRKDAARARGWAARLRAGWKPLVEPAGFPSDATPAPVTDNDDIPF